MSAAVSRLSCGRRVSRDHIQTSSGLMLTLIRSSLDLCTQPTFNPSQAVDMGVFIGDPTNVQMVHKSHRSNSNLTHCPDYHLFVVLIFCPFYA